MRTLNTCPCSPRAKFPMQRSTLKEMWFQVLETEIRKWATLVLSLLYIHSKNRVLPISSAFLLFKPWARTIPTVFRNVKFKGEETTVVFGLGTQIWKSLCLYKTKQETFFHVSCDNTWLNYPELWFPPMRRKDYYSADQIGKLWGFLFHAQKIFIPVLGAR